MTKSILTATIHREWLARILDGSKKIEYRQASDYWMNRLEIVGPPTFRLRLINGMSKDAPEATVLVDKVDIDILTGEIRLHIHEVLETLRWDPAWSLKYPPLPPEAPLDLESLTGKAIIETDIRLPVTADILNRLTPGALTTFCLPVDEETYARFDDAPDDLFTMGLEADGKACQGILISSYERYFDGEVEYTVVAR